jgi:hypothetical protein
MVIFIIAACKHNCYEEKELNNTWLVTTKDSINHEFYFDRERQYLFDGKLRHALDLNLQSNELNHFYNEVKTLNNDSTAIKAYIKKHLVKFEVFHKDTILSIKSVGVFYYKVSTDEYTNYLTFQEEAYKRLFNFYPNFENIEYWVEEDTIKIN